MRKILKAVGNAVVTCYIVVGAIIFLIIVNWQNRQKQKHDDTYLSDYNEF